MSDPSFPDPIRSVPPGQGTFDAVIAAARRRRRRRVGATGAVAAAVVLLAGVVTADVGGDGSQTIGVTDGAAEAPRRGTLTDDGNADDGGESTEPDPGGTRGSTPASPGAGAPSSDPDESPDAARSADPVRPGDPSAAPTRAPSPEPSPYPTPSRSVAPRPTPTPRPTRPTSTPKPSAYPSASETAAPQPSGEPSPEARGEMRRRYVDGATQCGDAEWCGAAHASGTGPVELVVRACRDADAGPGRLESGPPGADFAVRSGGEVVWRWSSGQAFPAILEYRDVQPGDCYEWSTTWRGVDDYNRPLPSGGYAGEGFVSGGQLSSPYRFSITLG